MQRDARITFIIKVLAEYSQYFKLASEMRAKIMKYFRLDASAAYKGVSISPSVQDKETGRPIAQSSVPENEANRTTEANQKDENPGPVFINDGLEPFLDMLPGEPQDLQGPPHLDDDMYDYFMSVSFDDWFTQN